MPKVTETHLAKIKIHPAAVVLPCLFLTVATTDSSRPNFSFDFIDIVKTVGIGFSILGFMFLILAYGSMLRGATTLNPSSHTDKLVTSGIYAFSRNPIYVGWFLFMLGLGISNLSIFVVLVSTLMLAVLYWAVILQEEEYLERRFGEEYLIYKSRVRRWL